MRQLGIKFKIFPLFIVMMMFSEIYAVAEESNQQISAPATQALPSTGTSKPFSLIRFAPSGIRQRIVNVTLVDSDCTSSGIAVPRVIEGPANGTLEFDKTDITGNWPAGTPREKCSDKKYPSLVLYYTSKSDYLGADGVKVLLIFPDGMASEWDVMIGVR